MIDAGGVDTIRSSVTASLDAGVSMRFVERLTLTGKGNINGDGNVLANVLSGDLGNDTMIGGAGNDTFLYNTALGASNIDQITSFRIVDDAIRLDER